MGTYSQRYGDFKKSNTQLQPTSYVEEFWSEQLHDKAKDANVQHKELTFKEAFELSIKYDIPIHPKFLFEFQAVSDPELRKLAATIAAHRSSKRRASSI